MQEINQLRAEIDKIDDHLIGLLKNRFEIVKKIGNVKKQNKVYTYDESRESEIYKKCKDDKIKCIFQQIIKQSKIIQNEK